MASRGPVEYVVIAVPGNRFKGEIVPAEIVEQALAGLATG
jgi:hypothetical protein